MNNISIYVGTFGKYVAGSLAGAWLNVADYESEEDFYTACKKLHNDEKSPENLRYYFDFEKFARDLFLDGYYFDAGHVFDFNR